jgi:cytochrome c-type biogenesis protein CcmH/NrfG
MSNTGDQIRKSLLKRQEALEKFKVRKESFLHFREQTKKDIEEAREIWAKTLEQLPKQEFN